MNLREKTTILPNGDRRLMTFQNDAFFPGKKKLFGIIPLTYVTFMVNFTHDKEEKHID